MSGDDASILPDLVAGRLSTAVVSDILDDLGHRDHVLDPAIRPLGDAPVIAGWANPFLVAEVDEMPADPYTGEIAAMDDIAPDDVVLVAAAGSARAACWGELFSTAALARGARATLIDGYCRDAQVIVALGYPVWCRGLLPLDVKGRGGRRRRRGRRPGPARRRHGRARAGQGLEGEPGAGGAGGGEHPARRLRPVRRPVNGRASRPGAGTWSRCCPLGGRRETIGIDMADPGQPLPADPGARSGR